MTRIQKAVDLIAPIPTEKTCTQCVVADTTTPGERIHVYGTSVLLPLQYTSLPFYYPVIRRDLYPHDSTWCVKPFSDTRWHLCSVTDISSVSTILTYTVQKYSTSTLSAIQKLLGERRAVYWKCNTHGCSYKCIVCKELNCPPLRAENALSG